MYLDLVIILNIVINYFLLWLTGFVIRQRTTFKRLMTGAIIGALFLLVFLLPAGVKLTWLGKLLLPPVMVLASFRPRLLSRGLLLLLGFYVCSFAMGGLVLVLNFWGMEPLGISGGIYHLPAPSLHYLFFAGFFLYVLLRFFGPLLLEKLNFHIPSVELQLEINFCGKSKTLSAFLDTGNMLREPFSGSPVAVTAYPFVEEMLPFEICQFLRSSKKMDWGLLEKVLSKINDAAKYYLIPYRSLHGEGFLLGFKPESVKLWQKGGDAAFVKKIVIGIQREKFIPEAGYEVLLPLDVWRHADKKEG
ncbi:MAG: sigma-E processing peptidase SpoIIGA [Firmicutes bacterium]|nr:sigma-E processing peptidase SpoIIGA [Bacillota bacterium]